MRALLLTSLVASAAAVPRVVRNVLGKTQHPDVHIDGFHVSGIYAVKQKGTKGSPPELVRRQFQFDEHPHVRDESELLRRSRRTVFPEFSTTVNSRDRLVTLAKLNLVAYPPIDDPEHVKLYGARYGSYLPETLAPAQEVGDLKFNTSSFEADLVAHKALSAAIAAELNETTDSGVATAKFRYAPGATARAVNGLAAIEYQRNGVRVIVFRGSWSPGDFANMELWITDWILEKMTDKYRTMWADAGLGAYTAEMELRATEGDTVARTGIRLGKWAGDYGITGVTSQEKLAEVVADGQEAGDPTVSGIKFNEDIAEDYGYWPLTRHFVDSFAADATTDNLLLTGHSQGGSRAQLASMYLQKRYGKTINGVTFSATGAGCFPQLLWSGKNYLDDVDPLVVHEQLTDYSHPLDPWGTGLGEDVGKECLYVTSPKLEETAGYRWCSKIWGYTGPALIWANAGFSDADIKNNFKICRYFTHFMPSVYADVSANGVFGDDGTPLQGTCFPAKIPTKCPTGDADGWFWAIIVVVVLAITVPICLIGVAIVRRCRGKGGDEGAFTG